MDKQRKEAVLLDAIGNPANIDLLYDVWSLLQRAPGQCAAILVQFKDVAGSAREAAVEIESALNRYDQIKNRLPELEDSTRRIIEWNKSMRGIDDGQVLNRLNRVIEAATKLAELKRNGGLEFIDALLKK